MLEEAGSDQDARRMEEHSRAKVAASDARFDK
jgi:hypothetical protein